MKYLHFNLNIIMSSIISMKVIWVLILTISEEKSRENKSWKK